MCEIIATETHCEKIEFNKKTFGFIGERTK